MTQAKESNLAPCLSPRAKERVAEGCLSPESAGGHVGGNPLPTSPCPLRGQGEGQRIAPSFSPRAGGKGGEGGGSSESRAGQGRSNTKIAGNSLPTSPSPLCGQGAGNRTACRT